MMSLPETQKANNEMELASKKKRKHRNGKKYSYMLQKWL